jgi:hypothetical protein
MTMVISCFVKQATIQVSDRRLTTPQGEVRDDAANKAICLWCSDAHVAIAFSGLAQIGKVPTIQWLFENLLRSRAGCHCLADIGNKLRDDLTFTFNKLRNLSYRFLTFYFTGYLKGAPFWGYISNQIDNTGRDVASPMNQFVLGCPPKFHWPPPSRKAFLATSGEPRAIPEQDSIDKRIKHRQRKLYYQSPYITAGELVSYIRCASRHPMYGSYIGRNCTAIVVLPNSKFRCRAYPEKASPFSFMPNIIGCDIGLADLSIKAALRKR